MPVKNKRLSISMIKSVIIAHARAIRISLSQDQSHYARDSNRGRLLELELLCINFDWEDLGKELEKIRESIDEDKIQIEKV